MHSRHGRSLSATLLIRILGCFLALGVALVLPALRTHHFGQLYRPVEVRQAAARHSVLDFEDSRGEVQIDQAATSPLPDQLPIENRGDTAPMRTIAVLTATAPTPAFMVRRLRLGGSRSSPPDPLLV
jgi:hypothetical protein